MATVKVLRDVTRGTPVSFSTTFFDANNVIVTAPSATLTLYYKSNGTNTLVDMSMSGGANNDWTAIWDSSNADIGNVEWSVRAGGTILATQDGNLRILANRANREQA